MPIVTPISLPVQVHRVPLKSPGGTTIPSRKATPPRPVCSSLNTWRYYPHLRHTCAASVAQLLIQIHLNHLYHPVTGQRETYEKLKLRRPKRWITSMSNELGHLASGVGERMASGRDTFFFIHKNQVPPGRKATYYNSVCDYRP